MIGFSLTFINFLITEENSLKNNGVNHYKEIIAFKEYILIIHNNLLNEHANYFGITKIF